MTDKAIHHGRNLKRIREILGVKQEALAMDLGDDWNQQKISLLEQKEHIEPKLIAQIAKILDVSPDAIENYNEEATINYIANTFNGSNAGNYLNSGNHINFNPIDKVVELYERLLALEKEKFELMQKK